MKHMRSAYIFLQEECTHYTLETSKAALAYACGDGGYVHDVIKPQHNLQTVTFTVIMV